MPDASVQATAMTQKNANPEVSVVMISYNTADMTVAAIRSLYETAGDVDFELLVYDNDSKDGSPEQIETAFPAHDYPSLTFVRLAENVGQRA